jgi:hypothetical protein
MPYPAWKRFIRQFSAFLIAILIMIVSFVIVIYAKYEQNQLNQEFNSNIDCSYIEYTQSQIIEEY